MIQLPYSELVMRLLAAAVCGAILGLNRDIHHKAAGFRTFGIVAVGAALLTLAILQIAGHDASAISRVIQGVVTGIGFLGGGVILHQTTARQVSGLTTAAAIWLTAGLGIACAMGLYVLALCAVILTFFILIIGKRVEMYFERIFEWKEDPDAASATKSSTSTVENRDVELKP